MAEKNKSGPLPTEKALVELIEKSGKALSRREIARKYKLSSTDRRALGANLELLAEEGKIRRGRNRRYTATNFIPAVSVLEVAGLDEDGDIILRLTDQRFQTTSPRIQASTRKLKGPAPGIGDRVLARLEKKGGVYIAQIIKRSEQNSSNIIGIFRRKPGLGIVEPSDRRVKTNFLVNSKETGGADNGELVECETVPGREHGLPLARVITKFGAGNCPSSIVAALVAKHEIPKQFSTSALLQAEKSNVPSMEGREDLRKIPLITIDDENARDFDDAVWAERSDTDNG